MLDAHQDRVVNERLDQSEVDDHGAGETDRRDQGELDHGAALDVLDDSQRDVHVSQHLFIREKSLFQTASLLI